MTEKDRFNKFILPNKIRIVTEEIPYLRSAAIGIIVGAGSWLETNGQSGISHFIEHMCFKGTPTRTAQQIAQTLDAVGGKMNASTGKENTSYYAVVLDEHFDLAIDLLADVFNNSLYNIEDIQVEKGVVLEEIKMYEDTPDELIHDLFAQTIWEGHPMGRAIIGKKESVKDFQRQDIIDYRKKFYCPDSIIISVAGNINQKKVVEKVERYFGVLAGDKESDKAFPCRVNNKIKNFSRKTEQIHFCLGTKGISYLDQDKYVMAAMNTILGGSVSSRLFQNIREKRGLAYSIYSYYSAHRDDGYFCVYAGTSPDKNAEVVNLVLKEFTEMKKVAINDELLKMTKEQLKGNLVLSLEGSAAQMNWLGRNEFCYGRFLTLEEIFKEIEDVSADDIIRLANEIFDKQYLNLVSIGPADKGLVNELNFG